MTKKLVLTGLSLLAISVAAIAATFANFTAAPIVIPTSSVATGTLALSAPNAAIYSLANAKIGDTATGSIVITNTGSLPGILTLTGSVNAGSYAGLASQLTLKIYADTDNLVGALVYNGSLGAFATASPTQTIAAAGTHTYYFHVTLPSAGTDAADNLLQGKTVTSTFTWNATQA